LQLAQVLDGKIIPATAMNGELPQKPHPLSLLQVKFVMTVLFIFAFLLDLAYQVLKMLGECSVHHPVSIFHYIIYPIM
jgi:hypothetical protein